MKQPQFHFIINWSSFFLMLSLFVLHAFPIQAAANTDATDFVDVTPSVTVLNQRIYANDQSASGNPLGKLTFPTITKITANYTTDGHITKRTNQFQVTFAGTFSTGKPLIPVIVQPYNIHALYASAFSSNVFTSSSTDLLPQLGTTVDSTNTVSFPNSGLTTSVPWSFQGQAPYYLGLQCAVSSRPADADSIALVTWPTTDEYTLTPTITTPIKDTDTTITGTGSFPNDVIVSNATNTSTTVNADGTYTLPVGDSLRGRAHVKVTEINPLGTDNPGNISAPVQASPNLIITSTTQTVPLNPDKMTPLITKNDADIIATLVHAAGISATDTTAGASDGITFASNHSNLGAKLAALIPGGQMHINIYATKDGVDSAPLQLTVISSPGTVALQTPLTPLNFPTTVVPIGPINLTPVNPNILITDTRAVGATWTLSASATPLTTASGRPLPGELVAIHDGTTTSLTATTTIATGTKVFGQSTINATADWSPTNGIFLHVNPGVLADQYHGTITWTLANAPN
ncbi:WxL domain-containing protein [Furfurilactobacillus entadae]|uniref:hypothetical protein n=1 Tax=Furfurilactobacillus entadae TaxID=2922307 RepID=UPI0035E80581